LILNPNSPPVILNQTKNTPEHQAAGTSVGTIQASGSGNPITYSITSGNIGNAFAIDTVSGNLSINKTEVVCYEGHPVFNLTINVKNKIGLASNAIVTINVLDINENPVCSDQAYKIFENSPDQTIVGSVVAKDYDFNQTLTYSIVSGNRNNAFKIDPNNGMIKVNNSNAVNYEDNTFINLIVLVQDNGLGNLGAYSVVTVELLDINEPPIMENQELSVIENSTPGTQIGYLKATDPDRGQAINYEIVSGNDNKTFNLNNTTGLVSVADPSKLSYGRNSLFALTVIAKDNGIDSLSTLSVITIKLLQDSTGSVVTGTELATATESFSNNDITIYPNPTADYVNINLEKVDHQMVDIRIFNMTGYEIYSSVKKGEKNVVVNMDDEKPGTYIARINVDGQTYSKNIVVQKKN